jgi:signal transduction histidine kinase
MKGRIRALSLRFEDEAEERAYLVDAFSDYARPLRLALVVGIALYAGFVWVDRYLFGHLVGELLVNRAIVCLLALGLFGLTYREGFARWVRQYISILHVVVVLGSLHMSTLHRSYEGGIYASAMFFPLLTRAQFQFSMFVNALVLLSFGVIRADENGLAPVLIDVSMLFAALVVIGLAAYVKERSARAAFVQKQALAAARDEALAASRAKSTFLANMSHELRTPLNAVIGYGEMVQEEARDAGHDAYIPDLQKIVSSGRHLLGLIDDILDLSKIEAGRVQLASEEFDVDELVHGAAATVAPLVARNENRLDIAAGPSLGKMRSDPMRTRQILLNLLSNAAKFTRQGAIRLHVRREPAPGADRIVFTVHDTGVGMTREQMGRIFDAFSQADASTARSYGGTGLGLTITKRFAEMLGGEISVESEPGRGSTFQVWLPAELSRGVVPEG